jgi:tripartite-type tricarboxylate transporter receptor subunit TctC
MRRRDFVGWSAAAAASWLARAAVAQETNPNHAYPNRPIHVIVPSSAGGVHDVVARIWADRVKTALGAMVIENRSGGGASIAINAVAQSQPDGYTLLLGSTSNLVLREGLGNRVYDAAKDLAAASIFATTSTSITVNPAVPARTVNELIDFIKANPGRLSYGSGGTGAITHITVEMFKQMAGGLDIVHVPYKGMAPAMNDLLSGEIAVGFVNITAQVIALHRGGKIRILAVNAPARLAAAPDIPTAIEAGVTNFVSQTFFGLFAAAGTPKAVLDKINQATQTTWSDKDFQQRLVESGFEPMLGYGPERADTYLKQEIARWAPIVQKIGTGTQ